MQLRSFFRRWGDLAVAVALAGGSAVEIAVYPPAPLPLAPAVGAISVLSLALRRRLPIIVYLIDIAGFASVEAWAPGFNRHSIVMIVAFFLALYSGGRHARGLEAWLGVPAVAAAVVMLELQDTDVSLNGVLFYTLFAGLPWGAGVVVRLRIERVAELRAQNAALEEEARRAVAEERSRIARELHDVVSHTIAVSVLQARGSRRLVGRDDGAVVQALDAIEATNRAALSDMRRLLSLLRDADDPKGSLDPAPTLDRLADLVDQVRAAGVTVQLDIEGERLPITPGVELSAYRIVQEALTNVVKHGGPGASAVVRIRYRAEDLGVEVESTVAEGEEQASEPGGHGLVGIRERATVVGGSVQVGPFPGGWRVAAAMPYLARA